MEGVNVGGTRQAQPSFTSLTDSTHCWDIGLKKKSCNDIVRFTLPVLVDAVDGELEVCVLALDADVVPREVVEAEAARRGHLRLARTEVDVHLQKEGIDSLG